MTKAPKDILDEAINPDAVNADFPNRDLKQALGERREELLDLMDDADDQSWRDNPNDELRQMLRATTREERTVELQLDAASATMRRDFDLSMD